MTFVAVIIAILVLLIMITIHEFGHYIAGKIFKFKINEFSIGMGPALFKKKKKNGEIFAIRVLPLGGYCAFEGEDAEKTTPDSFNAKKPWQRIIVLIAGATMNYLLALLIIVTMFSCYGKSIYGAKEIVPSTAYEYSLNDGDLLLEVNGRNALIYTDLAKALKGKKEGDVVKCRVVREGKEKVVRVTLRGSVNTNSISDLSSVCRALGLATVAYVDKTEDTPYAYFYGDEVLLRFKDYAVYSQENYLNCARIYTANELIARLRDNNGRASVYVSSKKMGDAGIEPVNPDEKDLIYERTIDFGEDWDPQFTDKEILGKLGIKIDAYYSLVNVNYKEGFWRTIGDSFSYSGRVGGIIFETLGELCTGKLGMKAVGGPVSTVVATTKIVKMGLKYLLQITAFIGVNLAIFNLLPIPALDGSRVVFTVIEWIFKRPVPKKIEGVIHTVGLVLLLGFSILADIFQLI